MTQAVLTTGRLILRPRGPVDAEACYAMNMEPGTLDHIAFPREGSWDDEAAHRAFIAETLAHEYPPGLGYWTVVPRDDPERFLGWVLLAPEDLRGPEVETGWRFLTSARGRGYATEAARALVAHGFDTLGLPRIVADIMVTNRSSVGVAEKIGMRPATGEQRDGYALFVIERGGGE